jgi:hypothetical protein
MELSRAISSGDLPSAIQQARAEIVTVSSQESMISPQDSICVDIMDRTNLAFGGEDEKHRSHKKHERRRADGIIS